MSLLTIAEVIFFLAYGISYFHPFKHSQKICAFAAISVGILLLVRI